MGLVQMAILVVFASVCFAATVRLFFIWAAVLLAIYASWLLMLDIPPISKIYNLTNFSTFVVFALYFNYEIDRRARDAAASDRGRERARRRAAARIVAPRTGPALLPALGRIDAEQADALAGNLDRIAVDDARAARDRRTGSGRRRDVVRAPLADDMRHRGAERDHDEPEQPG